MFRFTFYYYTAQSERNSHFNQLLRHISARIFSGERHDLDWSMINFPLENALSEEVLVAGTARTSRAIAARVGNIFSFDFQNIFGLSLTSITASWKYLWASTFFHIFFVWIGDFCNILKGRSSRGELRIGMTMLWIRNIMVPGTLGRESKSGAYSFTSYWSLLFDSSGVSTFVFQDSFK